MIWRNQWGIMEDFKQDRAFSSWDWDTRTQIISEKHPPEKKNPQPTHDKNRKRSKRKEVRICRNE